MALVPRSIPSSLQTLGCSPWMTAAVVVGPSPCPPRGPRAFPGHRWHHLQMWVPWRNPLSAEQEGGDRAVTPPGTTDGSGPPRAMSGGVCRLSACPGCLSPNQRCPAASAGPYRMGTGMGPGAGEHLHPNERERGVGSGCVAGLPSGGGDSSAVCLWHFCIKTKMVF